MSVSLSQDIKVSRFLCTFAQPMERHLYIISGCNGAGKTTASYTVLPEILKCNEFVNADEIARGLSPFNPESVAIEAGRLMLERINHLLQTGISFSIETTLATRSYQKLIERAQAQGYTVLLLYFWLNSPELAIERVAQRVNEGGHNIAEPIIRRHYALGLSNLTRIFMTKVDEWFIFNNTDLRSVRIAQRLKGKATEVFVPYIYNIIINL